MNVLTSTKRFSHYLIISLTLILLSACSSQRLSKNSVPLLFSELNHNSAFFLKKADKGNDQQNLEYQFLATQALISEEEPTLANSIIEYLQSQELTQEQQSSLRLLIADNLNLQNRPDQSLKVLNNTNSKALSDIGFIHFLKVQTQLQINKEAHLDASNNLFILTPLLKTKKEKQEYNEQLFNELVSLPIDFLEKQQTLVSAKKIELATSPVALTEQNIPFIDPFKEGWYSLAYLYKMYQLRPNQLIRSINDWKAHHLTHTAFQFMPAQLKDLSKLSPYQAKNIAVLIPLSGRYKEQGLAVQYGLLHAYYEQLSKQETASTEITFNFYDTQSQNMDEIVSQFKSEKIDFVIGPLLKSNVEKFLPLAKKMPALTLNSFPKELIEKATKNRNKQIAWHYAFPLSPEEEAKQAANMMFHKGHKIPLLLVPDSTYGKRITQAFNQEWAALTNNNETQVETYSFNGKAQLASFIAEVLQTDKSKRRIDQMKLITKLPLETKLRSRRDVDAIYIVSKRDELIMLKAFIDVSVSPFAATIPLYASSRSHIHDKQSKELSMLTFSDSPFLLDKNNETLKYAQSTLKKQSFADLRLFALGFDSYQLIEQLVQLQNIQEYTYKGLIGELSLDENNTVQAKLGWAKYYRGKLIEITTPISAE